MWKSIVTSFGCFCLFTLFSGCVLTDESPELKMILNGRYATISKFKSQHLSLARDIVIYLPADYETSNQTYPVVYMHDGQNLFNDNEAAFGKAWNVDNVYDGLIADNLIDPLIIVGINNTSQRIAEYTPTLDPFQGGGLGDSYSRFIIDELIPYINTHLRTKTGPENTAIIGSSLGGLLSFYAAKTYPQTFGMAGCLSPSFWWDNQKLLKAVEGSSSLNYTNVKFWLDAGTAEGDDPDGNGRPSMIEDAGRMAQKLEALGWEENVNLGFLEDVGKGHNETAWEGRIGNILYFFFRKAEPTLTSIVTRTYLPKIGMTGLDKTWASLDLIYDTNNFRLTQLNTQDSFTTNPGNIIQINKGVVTPEAEGTTNINAALEGLQAVQVSLGVVENLSPNVNITFNVTCPTSPTANIYLAGNGGPVPGNKTWEPAGVKSDEKISTTNFKFNFTMKRGSSFSYKFTRTGSWTTEEIIGADRVYTNNGEDEVVDLTVANWKN